MTLSPTCQQNDCLRQSAYRYTWPGRDEATVCERHVGRLRAVIEAMGLRVELILIEAGLKRLPAKDDAPCP